MKAWFDRIMNRRARELTRRLGPWIPPGSLIADIGSGTGHNALAWRTELAATVDEFDVADLHWVGMGPVIFDGFTLPVEDQTYPIVAALFVLQYSPQPVQLLQELRRISAGRVILIQSTYRGWWGRCYLSLREIVWGPIAFYVASIAGLVRGASCPLIARTLYSRQELALIFQQAGLTVRYWQAEAWWRLWVSRDLYVLDPFPVPATSPSSSRLATKSAG